MNESVQNTEVSPSSTSTPTPYRPTSRIGKALSFLLDSVIRIPGTDIRIGLDPILGLLPWGGDAIATIMGSSLLVEGARKGVPARVLLKMTFNSTLNALVGSVPVIGDLFSVFYRSNNRNYDLLQKHMGEESPRAILKWLMGFICFSLCCSVIVWTVVVWIVMRPLVTKLFAAIGNS